MKMVENLGIGLIPSVNLYQIFFFNFSCQNVLMSRRSNESPWYHPHTYFKICWLLHVVYLKRKVEVYTPKLHTFLLLMCRYMCMTVVFFFLSSPPSHSHSQIFYSSSNILKKGEASIPKPYILAAHVNLH